MITGLLVYLVGMVAMAIYLAIRYENVVEQAGKEGIGRDAINSMAVVFCVLWPMFGVIFILVTISLAIKDRRGKD